MWKQEATWMREKRWAPLGSFEREEAKHHRGGINGGVSSTSEKHTHTRMHCSFLYILPFFIKTKALYLLNSIRYDDISYDWKHIRRMITSFFTRHTHTHCCSSSTLQANVTEKTTRQVRHTHLASNKWWNVGGYSAQSLGKREATGREALPYLS